MTDRKTDMETNQKVSYIDKNGKNIWRRQEIVLEKLDVHVQKNEMIQRPKYRNWNAETARRKQGVPNII